MNRDLDRFLPLSPATLHILLALATGDLHGYAIMQEIRHHSEGRYKIGPGTLYDSLQRLMGQGLVEECPQRTEGDDPRRRYYRLTSLGRGVLSAEVFRLEGVLQHARSRLEAPEPRSI